MKGENLFEAIGMMDEDFLEENMAARENKPRRILWKTALVAAILSCLAVTVAAVAVGELLGRTERQNQELYMTDVKGNAVSAYGVECVEVYIEWQMRPDAAMGMDEFYVPSALNNEDLIGFGVGDDGENTVYSFTLNWTGDTFAHYETITFDQFCGFAYDPTAPVDTIMGIPADVEVRTRTLVREEQAYFLVSCEQWDELVTCINRLYWTDGYHIFRLIYPNWMTDEQILDIAASLEREEDIQPYFEIARVNGQKNLERDWEEFLEEMASGAAYDVEMKANRGWTQINEFGTLDIYAELPLSENASEYVERIVYPRYFDTWKLYGRSGGENEIGMLAHTIIWENPENKRERVWFSQYGCGDYRDSQNIDQIIDMEDPHETWSGLTEIGEYCFFEVSFEKGTGGAPGARYLYWTDGIYIFSLRLPYKTEDSEILSIIESIR